MQEKERWLTSEVHPRWAFRASSQRKRNPRQETPAASQRSDSAYPAGFWFALSAPPCPAPETPSRCISNPQFFARGLSICAALFPGHDPAKKPKSYSRDTPAGTARAPKAPLSSHPRDARNPGTPHTSRHAPNHQFLPSKDTKSSASSLSATSPRYII